VELSADAGPALDALQAEIEAEGVDVAYRELKGLSAPRALHEAAAAEDAGLLVVGSRREGAVGRVLPGSTAERLMHGAPCPIAVVPAGWQADDFRDIGAAYVASDEGAEALRAAHALAFRAGATLHVLAVVKVNYGLYAETRPGQVVYPPEVIAEVESENRAWAQEALRAALARLDGDVPIEAETVVDRDPAEPLLRASEHLDLLVCGSRGYGPLRSVLLGGVSRRVAGAARCPVIVVPRGVRAAVDALIEQAGAPAAG
jgi:nucleotide-binding universal stress UspA family protein